MSSKDLQKRSNKLKIVHVFMGRRYHHVPSMIQNILQYSKRNHFFIIYFFDEDKDDGSRYRELFKSVKCSSFAICRVPSIRSIWEKNSTASVSSTSRRSLHYLLFKKRKSPIIFHGEYTFRRGDRFLFFLFSPLFRSLNWVCWGNIPGRDVDKIHDSTRTTSRFLSSRILQQELDRFARIVCLLDGDYSEITSKHSLSNAVVIPYPSIAIKLINPSLINREIKANECQVLLGNSAVNVENYGEIVDKLTRFSSRIVLRVMLSYGKPVQEIYESFLRKARITFGDSFVPWTEQVPINQYIECLNDHDIYICNCETQTGLAAIYYSLILGKKLYLRGYNFDWIRKNGFIIRHVDDLSEEDYEEFAKPLSINEKNHNSETFKRMFSYEEVAAKWESFYEAISI